MLAQSFTPNIQPAGTTHSRNAHRRPSAGRSPSFYGVVAGVVVAALATAILIPQALKKQHAATPITVTHPVATTPTTTIAMPSQLAGYIQLVGAKADSWQQESDKDWPLSTPHLAALYGTTDNPRILVMVGKVSLTPTGVNAILDGGEKGVGEAGWQVTFHQQATGEYGGQMRCATTVRDGTSAAICIFADSDVFGQIWVLGQGATGVSTAMTTRTLIETRS